MTVLPSKEISLSCSCHINELKLDRDDLNNLEMI